MPIRILLVDGHRLVRAGLRLLLESQADFKVAGEGTSRKEALVLAVLKQPDIILLEIFLKPVSGLDFLADLRAAAPQAGILVLTSCQDSEVHRRAVLLGAMGIVLKEQTPQVLFKAIERVHNGETWFDRNVIEAIQKTEVLINEATQRQQSAAAAITSLTDREREIIALVGQRLKNKQIAQRLLISEATVRNHLTSIFHKLGVPDRLELIIFAYRHSLAEPPQ